MQLIAQSPSHLTDTAASILKHAADQRIFLFYGAMGAGKTTLIKSLCACLGTADTVTSPTFSIVNQYNGLDVKIYHFDFYRIKNEGEALDLGYEEYFYSGDYCFIEWPEKIPSLLPGHYLRIDIDVLDDDTRRITLREI